MKVFISQPMHGKTDAEIKEARTNAINTVCRTGIKAMREQ